MTSWGVVATVKAPEEQLLAFVAHHLALGAAHLWIYFDDPEDPAFDCIARLPLVTARRCTDWYWVLRGGRSRVIDNRQKANARHVQRKCKLDWLCHIDADEFLHAPRPIADILAEVPASETTVRMDAFEALHDPALADDIFTARHFRSALQDGDEHLIPAIFGPYAGLLAKGSLAHGLGKSFVRPRTRGLVIDLHLARHNDIWLKPPFHPALRLLHFHAQEPVAWKRSLPERISSGAYRHPVERDLRPFLASASDEALQDFYRNVMMLTPEKAEILVAHGHLVTADLGLRAKVAALLDARL